jgi:UDP-N-acetyl-alpha-D-muramoyl-L-alanyl-L-glutamate epimerase
LSRFCYDGYHVQPGTGVLTCRYSLGEWRFEEQFALNPDGGWASPAAADAVRLVFLLAGVSYYKTAAPPVIDLGDTAVTDVERDFLRRYYLEGLGEFAYRNELDLSGLRIEGPAASGRPARRPATSTRPLIPFGGGIDSIVTVEHVRRHHPDSALFVMSRPGSRFEAIERPAKVTGLPVVRAERQIDLQLSEDARRPQPRFRNGHVPVTGILSGVAVLAAVLAGRDAVVMSNEWSASKPTIESGGRPINHQYSKSAAFEAGFRTVLGQTVSLDIDYFSALRARTELWVADEFARLPQFHDSFHSCNKAFYLDPAKRLDHWCGECDKCCFIDLILAPFVPAADLRRIFGGREPLENLELLGKFQALLGVVDNAKPFECVGDVQECQVATRLAAARPDRAGTALLHLLAKEIEDVPLPPAADLLVPAGSDFVPAGYAS